MCCFIVLFQSNKLGFSWSVSVQGKALLAANGRRPLQEEHQPTGSGLGAQSDPEGVAGVYSINASMDANRPTLRAPL